ncbi:MAG: alpha-amylase family protein [Chloroflexota bacterium]
MKWNDFLPYRQIHLDFHTSEAIEGIGADFDPDAFADMLVKAHVNSITVFARCHHGWIYYDSKRHPERVHPHLTRNLMKDQIDACHARGIRVPIYTTVQWDHYTAGMHPEWLMTDEQGMIQGTPPFEAGFYRFLNVNSPYVDFLKVHVEEMLNEFDVDGFFFDIVQPRPSADRYTIEKMIAAGLDPTSAEQRVKFGLDSLNDFKREMTAFVRERNSDCSIFYNGGHVGTRHRPIVDAYSHFELETLPSGHWGYQHFPVSMRYARNHGIDCLAQTGKFHTAWGDFHSFKNLAALQYECFRIIAMGGKCMIGDQLPPRGTSEQYVYELIGKVYGEIAEKEPWCHGAKALNDIAVYTPEEVLGANANYLPAAIKGVSRMLEEHAYQFDIIDSHSDLSGYKVVIMPDEIPTSSALAAKLEAYLADGGALIASFESGLNEDKTDFATDALGVSKASDGPVDLAGNVVRGKHFGRGDYVDYLLPEGAIGQGLPPTEHAMYMRGLHVEALADAEVLAPHIAPYFDRTWEHFCSHRQTPSSGQQSSPAIVRKGNAIYFTNPIFNQYHQNAPRWCKQLFLNALGMLLPEPLITHQGPSTIFATLNEQTNENRRVLHLLHYIPERRGIEFDVIEDVIPLYDVAVSVRVDQTVQRVQTAPQGDAIAFEATSSGDAQRVNFVLPKLDGHQMIAIEF